MSSYNDYDGIPVQASRLFLTDRLRGEHGFKGYVVSDSDAVKYIFACAIASRSNRERHAPAWATVSP
jgi:beta-glucosidase-like glycosyl hydrolase